MNKIDILWVCPSPLSPYAGDNVSVYNVLKYLQDRFRFHLVAHCQSDLREMASISELEAVGLRVASAKFFMYPPIANKDRLRGLFGSFPPGVSFMERVLGHRLLEYVQEVISKKDIRLLHVWGPGLSTSFLRIKETPKILNAGDSFSLIHHSFATTKSFPANLYHKIVVRRFKWLEQEVYGQYDGLIFYSQRDMHSVRLPSGISAKMIPCGANLTALHPKTEYRLTNRLPVLIFHGFMGHPANQNTVQYITQVLGPALTRHLGDNGFEIRIVGKDMYNTLGLLKNRHSWLNIVGYVDELEIALHQADVYIAPIWMGVGIKNKVLDAMACGLPIVGSPEAFVAILCEDGQHCLIREHDHFVDGIVELLNNEKMRIQIGKAARQHIEKHFTWESIAKSYAEFYNHIVGIRANGSSDFSKAKIGFM